MSNSSPSTTREAGSPYAHRAGRGCLVRQPVRERTRPEPPVVWFACHVTDTTDYRVLKNKNTKPPIGHALTDEEQQRLFATAESRPEWIFAYVAWQGRAHEIDPTKPMESRRSIRRKGARGAAKALEPTFALAFPEHTDRPREKGHFVARAARGGGC